jgi:hypothetical protein
MLGDPCSTTGDHQICATGVTSDDDRVIDWRLDKSAHNCRSRVILLVNHWRLGKAQMCS